MSKHEHTNVLFQTKCNVRTVITSPAEGEIGENRVLLPGILTPV